MGIMEWLQANWIEIVGTAAGFIYIFLEIKANKWMWPVGLITSTFYVVVFFNSKFYADMSLQFYYIFISIYGWYWWVKGEQSDKKIYQISKVTQSLSVKLFLFFAIAMGLISYILVNYTDSSLPYWDAFTTALSIVATWMLARKVIEHWYLWVLINLVSMGLYLYKGLYPTSGLHLVYTIFAVIGYFEWKRMFYKQKRHA